MTLVRSAVYKLSYLLTYLQNIPKIGQIGGFCPRSISLDTMHVPIQVKFGSEEYTGFTLTCHVATSSERVSCTLYHFPVIDEGVGCVIPKYCTLSNLRYNTIGAALRAKFSLIGEGVWAWQLSKFKIWDL